MHPHACENGGDALVSDRIDFIDLAPATAQVRDAVGEGWARLLDSNTWIGGTVVDQFERAWARYCGTAEAIGVANGTDALHLVLRGLGIGRGDEVIVPANTFIATAEAVVLSGARPRFVDVDPDSLLMTPETVAAAITPATAAVLAVHLYGHVADVAGLSAVCRRHGIALIEDAAQAHGATRDGCPCRERGRGRGLQLLPGEEPRGVRGRRSRHHRRPVTGREDPFPGESRSLGVRQVPALACRNEQPTGRRARRRPQRQ